MAYSRINWQNEPSEATALNDVNLNKMDSAIYELDGKATTTETAITALQDGKVDKVSGKGLSELSKLTITPDTTEGKFVASIKMYDAEGAQTSVYLRNGVTVDSALSNSSTNPVQNKVVKSAIDGKSTVAISDTLETGTTLANITIDGTTTAIKGSDIEVDEELSPTSTNPVENKAIYDALNNLLPSKTVSGNPIAISDASGFDAKALTVTMNPIQDLHGYEYPWVGGAGKNKFKTTATTTTIAGVTYTVNDDGTITVSGTATGYSSLTLGVAEVNSSMGNVSITGITDVTNIIWSNIAVRDAENNVLYQVTSGSQTLRFTVDLSQYPDANNIIIAVKRNSNGAVSGTLKPQVEIGTVGTNYAPYENICPISGRDSVTVTRTGDNFFANATFIQGTIDGTGSPASSTTRIRSSSLRLIPKGTYKITTSPNLYGTIRVYSTNSFTSYISGESVTSWTLLNDYSFTLTSDRYVVIVLSKSNSEQITITPSELNSISFVLAETVETHTHNYASTVYGGVDDFVSGEGTSEYYSRNCDGTEDWQTNGSSGVYIRPTVLSPNAKSKGNVLMSIYKKVSDGEAPPNGCWNWNSAGTAIQIRDERAMTASTFKTLIATDNNLQICYELATPTTISTSAEEITLLKGNNVLSTNADDIELKYSVSLDSLLPTTTRTLAKSVAPIEEKTEVVKEPEEETKEER